LRSTHHHTPVREKKQIFSLQEVACDWKATCTARDLRRTKVRCNVFDLRRTKASLV
jgi:hypothetical protein